ncbi:MAG: ABC transporter substrate binding protein [Spongiibacteraceae bacterium]
MKRLLCLILWLSIPLLAAAEQDITRIDIIASSGNTAIAELAKGIQYALVSAKLDVDTHIQKPDDYKNTNPATTLVITIGDNSLPWLSEQKNPFAATVAFHVSANKFLTQTKSEQRSTALFRDQPLSRQLKLAKFLLPNLKRISVLHSADFPTPVSKEIQRNLQIGVDEINIDKNSDWLKSLSLSLRETDALLGIEDQKIYNGETIRGILLTTYRQGKSLIGPSKAFVNAGSLASCYTSTDQYLQQLVDMVTIIIREHRIPEAQYPKAFRVAINKQVGNSLNISIPDESELSAWLQNNSGECGHGC